MQARQIITLATALLLTACSGGGGGGGSTTTASTTSTGSSTATGGSTLSGNTGSGTSSGTNTATTINDPLFAKQWHLENTGQEGGTAGVDINVQPVWQAGLNGSGVSVSVIDDGLDAWHEDLLINTRLASSLNMASNSKASWDPTPENSSDDHGTSVGGLIAAAANSLGGRGVAYGATLLGVNLLAASSADSNDATALLHGKSLIAISNNSWGNPDSDNELGYSGPLAKAAIEQGATTERGGKGIVYLFAAGNGATQFQSDGSVLQTGQRSGYDSFNNTPYALNIAAVQADGTPSGYSEPGANVLVSAPSDSTGSVMPGLYTTTVSLARLNSLYRGQPWLLPNYRPDFGGTSGATPITAGVVALMLQANPSLSWRDIRWILASTARSVSNATETGTSAMGHGIYSHKTGFGLIDANAAVAMAKTHTALPAMKTCTLALANSAQSPDSNGQLQLATSNGSCDISQLESADLSLQLDQPGNPNPAGQLAIQLDSPSARSSILATPHSCFVKNTQGDFVVNSCSKTYSDWAFHSVRHMGENPAGQWTLKISGMLASDTLAGSQLVLRGF